MQSRRNMTMGKHKIEGTVGTALFSEKDTAIIPDSTIYPRKFRIRPTTMLFFYSNIKTVFGCGFGSAVSKKAIQCGNVS